MARTATGIKTKTIGLNITQEMADQLEERASSMHLSTSKYCKIIFAEWLSSGKKLNLTEK
jgi:hypothetical protein